MLAGPRVIEATAEVFAASAHLPLPRRFVMALKAGEDAGGDKRGKQSAAMLIHDAEEYPFLDIRVDDHTDPLGELARLEEVSGGRYLHYRQVMPTKDNPPASRTATRWSGASQPRWPPRRPPRRSPAFAGAAQLAYAAGKRILVG
jgi:uncharacterized Ntn-hydrolase superfamily protein